MFSLEIMRLQMLMNIIKLKAEFNLQMQQNSD